MPGFELVDFGKAGYEVDQVTVIAGGSATVEISTKPDQPISVVRVDLVGATNTTVSDVKIDLYKIVITLSNTGAVDETVGVYVEAVVVLYNASGKKFKNIKVSTGGGAGVTLV